MSLVDELQDGTDWPSIAWEEHDWQPSIPAELMTRAQRETFRGPYYSAVVPEIAGLTPLLPSSAATASEEATNAIARFDAEMGAEVAPFAAILLRSESAASSQIENLTSGAKQIALAELGSRDKRNATQIVGNVEAMKAAIDLAERFDEDAILAMHSALMKGHADDIAGRWRRDQVWIGGSSLGPHGAMYVAPTHEHVPALMSDLVGFARRTDIPLLTQAAIAHAQFETIHPFPDGNGRTGRALIHSMLRGHGLTRNITVPISAGLLTDTGRYFDTLTAYRDGDVAPIVERLADASFSAIANGAHLVRDLRGVRASWDDQVKARRDSNAWRLADVLIQHPVVDSPTVARELGIKIENARRAVNPLVDAGVLREFTGFSRNRMWEAKAVTEALDAFAARAGRRRLA